MKMLRNYEYMKAKIDLRFHPLVDEKYAVKLSYFTLLSTYLEKDKMGKDVKNILNLYKNIFDIHDDDIKNAPDIAKAVKLIVRTHVRFKPKKYIFNNYKYLLLAELRFLTDSIDWNVQEPFLESLIKKGKMANEKVERMEKLFSYFYCQQLQEASEMIKEHKAEFKYFSYFHDFFEKQQQGEQLDVPKVAVVATMSAGKSTFLNSIIGMNLFPSENKACTSKIIEFTNNPNLGRFIGLSEGERGFVNWDLTPENLKEWNKDPAITGIHLEGGIGKYSMIREEITFIDTPGPNNVRNLAHHNATISFLEKKQYTKVAYLLNVTQLAINDDVSLLETVLQHVSTDKIIFFLNQIDALDIENEEGINEIVMETKSYLQDYGVENPMIIPISSYAANLFKTVLQGNSHSLTRKQVRDFHQLYSQYEEPRYDVNRFFEVTINEEMLSTIYNEDVYVGEKKYQTNEIFQQLLKTGIHHAENVLMHSEGTL